MANVLTKLFGSSVTHIHVRPLTLVQRVPGSIPGRAQKLFPSLLAPLLHLTCGTGAVDDKDLAVICDHDNE